MTTPTLNLDRLATRCVHGYDLETQHPDLCTCRGSADALVAPTAPTDEWTTFTSALRAAAVNGVVHQADVRPLIRGVIEPKHIGLCWKRARHEGLVREIDHERSDDRAGRNAHRLEPVYELRAA